MSRCIITFAHAEYPRVHSLKLYSTGIFTIWLKCCPFWHGLQNKNRGWITNLRRLITEEPAKPDDKVLTLSFYCYSDLLDWNRKPFASSRKESENRNFVPRLSLIIVKWKEMAGEITKAINESKRRTWIPWMWFVALSTKPPTARAYAGHSAGLNYSY